MDFFIIYRPFVQVKHIGKCHESNIYLTDCFSTGVILIVVFVSTDDIIARSNCLTCLKSMELLIMQRFGSLIE